MNLALWIVAGLLAALFLFAGVNKVFVPREKLASAPGGGWVNDFGDGFVRTLGAVEILGAVGLILPEALDIAPVLTPLAALGLAVIMAGAVILRIRRRETTAMIVNLVYLMLALCVAFGRL